MTNEERLLLKSLLVVLDRMKQCEEEILYMSVDVKLHGVTRTDFDRALKTADAARWVTSVSGGPFRVTKWSLNDVGRAALLEM